MFITRALPKACVELICPNFIKIPVISRASAFVSHYFEIERVIKEKEIDAIVLYSVPTNGLQAIYWAKQFGIPVVFRSIDAINQLVPYSFLRPMVRNMERQVYSKVDRILTLTPKLSDYVVKLGANFNKVKVLPMTVDTDLFSPSDDTQDMREKWGLSRSAKVVLFMGTLFNFSGLDDFIREFSSRIVRHSEIYLMIVGDGQQRKELENFINQWNIKNVIITGFQPYEDMPKYINLADVCINTFIENDATRDIFPGKTVQFLACGKPLVMRPLAGVKSMIAGENQGVVYADTAESMADRIFSLLESPAKMEAIGNNGLEYARQKHGYEKVARQLESELLGLIR
jgi:glycosyltransferase involved in cell wall biosynthesis